MKRLACVFATLSCLLITACSPDTSSSHQVTPKAPEGVAEWQTWVLRSPGSVRVPSRRTETDVPTSVRRETSVVLGERWMRLAMEYVSDRTKNPPRASRAYAYVSVAAFDAMVSASHWREEPPPGVIKPTLDGAVAGAASRVLTYLFPEQSALRLDELARSEAFGAPGTADEALAGLDLGRAVAAEVVAFAKKDGSNAKWDGSPPKERSAWGPPPGSVSPPVEPLAGTWKAWVLAKGSELRPPPPPKYGSKRFLADVRELVDLRKSLTSEQLSIARFWEGGEGTALPPGVWISLVLDYLKRHPISGPEQVRALALLNVAMHDAGVAAWDAKYAYWSPRPENAIRDLVDPRWTPALRTPLFPAYVSGHSTYSSAAGVVLAELFPADAKWFLAKAKEAGESRILGGIHYRSDHLAGSRMGLMIGKRVVRRAHLEPDGSR